MITDLNKYFFDFRVRACVCIALSLGIIALLISYSASDPSFNTATNEMPSNLLGFYGAYVADILMQIFGLSAFLIPLYAMSIAFVLFYKRLVNWWYLRLFSLVIALISTSACLGMIPFNCFPAGPGGWIGYLFSPYLLESEFIFSLILIMIAITSFLFSTGWDRADLMTLNVKLKDQESFKATKVLKERISPVARAKIAPTTALENDDEAMSAPVMHQKVNVSDSSDYQLPTIDLLGKYNNQTIIPESNEQLEENAEHLLKVLKDFGVKGEIVGISQGPVVTLYELEPSAGTKSSRVIGLADDIARSLSAVSTRIAVIPGRNALGVELPNQKREFFSLRDLIETSEYQNSSFSLPIILGKDLGGKPAVVDLAKMPHLLVAGTTGSGKSVAINAMIISLLYKHSPESCKFIMIDPKMLELSVYDGIPHLLTPVVTEPGKAVVALKWAVKEMENRYRLMSNLGVRNIAGYNERVMAAAAKGEQLERTVQTGFDPETGKPIYESMPMEMKKLPFIVVIVDEMADLMIVAGKDIEGSIQRLAQMARAAGIHIIMATQRPSVDVITGVIKANFPSRVSFKVTSKIDSRTILGEQGSEQLLGMGDMLYMGSNSRIERFHGPFVDDREVENITQFLKAQGTPEYVTEVTSEEKDEMDGLDDDGGTDDDSLYKQAIAIVKRDRKASTSYIQRCLRIGYNRAALIVERMEDEGVLSEPNHSGKREILLPE